MKHPDQNNRTIRLGTDWITPGETLEIILCVIIAAQNETNPNIATQLRTLANRILDQIDH